jgi:hypothetical protein
MCQCAECKCFFSGTTGFDFHRIGPHDGQRRCMTPAELEAKGYIERDGVWRRNQARPEFLNEQLSFEDA